jgi:DNA (cytosine-5)-methyltransferase 1
LDTAYITPFFKKKFRRFSMKESGWLTRSIEQSKPFDLKFPGKIRILEVKKSFLNILNDIEVNKENPKKYLVALFILLIKQTKLDETKIDFILPNKQIPISTIIDALKKHFFEKYGVSGASRLPVIALYSIYEILTRDLPRFNGSKLLPLESHISCDASSKCIGDIQVMDNQDSQFEAIEVKHGISITSEIVEDAFQKFKSIPVKRYYILTTEEPNIKLGEEEFVKQKIAKIVESHGCEVIVNGLIHSIKYYLRLINNINEFLENYTKNIEKEFLKTTEIKKEHIQAWKAILEEIK